MIALLFAVFFALLALGAPIAFALGFSSLAYLVFNGVPLVTVPMKLYSGIDVFVLLSIPGFVLAGNLMNRCGMTDRIIAFCNRLVGHVRGGLGLANIGSSMVFAGISGTAVADTASIGSILIPAMKKEGYEADFSCAVTAYSSTIGPIIPPSMPMIVAGSLTGLSVGKLFVAGIAPGMLLGLGFMAASYLMSKRRMHPVQPRSSARQILGGFRDALWALVMTALILFGIIGGVFTPTEASIVASLYALLVGVVVYRSLSWRSIWEALKESASTTAALMLLVGFANLFGWILVSEQAPQAVAEALMQLAGSKWLLLLAVNVALLVVGTFMETLAALLILYPILLRVGAAAGVDEIQFTVMVVLNLIIGLATPPVGVCLFVASAIGKVSPWRIACAGWPFLVVSLVVLALVTYVPEVSLFLPRLFSLN